MKEMSLCKNTARNPTGGGKLMITKEIAPTTLTLVEKISKCESINEDLFIDAYSKILFISKDLFIAVFSQMVSTFFGMYDTDKNGLISEEGMKRGLKCFGIDQPDALKEVFAK